MTRAPHGKSVGWDWIALSYGKGATPLVVAEILSAVSTVGNSLTFREVGHSPFKSPLASNRLNGVPLDTRCWRRTEEMPTTCSLARWNQKGSWFLHCSMCLEHWHHRAVNGLEVSLAPTVDAKLAPAELDQQPATFAGFPSTRDGLLLPAPILEIIRRVLGHESPRPYGIRPAVRRNTTAHPAG